MTATQRALKIIMDSAGTMLTAHRFGGMMWPDSKAHSRCSKQGGGSCRGKGVWYAGGLFLGKLEKRGLIRRNDHEAWLTVAGHKLLDEAKEGAK